MISGSIPRWTQVACAGAFAVVVALGAVPHAQSGQPVQSAPSAGAEQTSLPEGRAVVDRYIEAIGGRDAIDRIQSWRARGTFELTGQGIAGSLVIMSARPAKSLVTLEIPGLGPIQSGFDGEVAWQIEPASGPALLTDKAQVQAADDARFDAVLHPADFTTRLDTLERLEFDGRPAYKVRVMYASGREQFEYFDVDTGLQLGTEGSRETPLGFVPTTTYLRNYKAFGDLMQATEIVQQPLGIEQVVRIQTFEYDVVPDDAFALPPQIQALVKR